MRAPGAPSDTRHRQACRHGRRPVGRRKCRKPSLCRLRRSGPNSARPRSACRTGRGLYIFQGCGRVARHPRWRSVAIRPNRNSTRRSSGSRKAERFRIATAKGLRQRPGQAAPVRQDCDRRFAARRYFFLPVLRAGASADDLNRSVAGSAASLAFAAAGLAGFAAGAGAAGWSLAENLMAMSVLVGETR